MPHPLVQQLQFTRRRFADGIRDVPPEDAHQRFKPMNSISWIVGHLAVHELRVWVEIAQGRIVAPEVLVCEGGRPASVPDFESMWHAWEQITTTADDYLNTLTQTDMTRHLMWQGEQQREDIGTMLQRNIYHYWYHLGEAQAIRQMLGHTDLLPFVGHIPPESKYTPESS